MEWPSRLNVEALLAEGWQPTPFQQFVLKVHSRCDLACDYCYVYESADQSWRTRPRHMSRETLRRTADRIAEHARAYGLAEVHVVLHGGEPLLAGPDLIREAVTVIRRAMGEQATATFSVQTNGTLLDRGFLELFEELGVGIGVSLDGDEVAQDRHRRRPNGEGSHAVVTAALRRLGTARFRPYFRGLLCTIDLRNDPVATYEALLKFEPPAIDLLLPHGNWETPPPQPETPSPTPYADWLIAVFDHWYHAPRRQTRIRLFEEILHLILGGGSATEEIGLSPVAVVVVETDGTIEQSDVLKSAYQGAPDTGLHVARDDFASVLRLPSIAARQIGTAALSPTCLACTEHLVCGGGLYAHRYRPGNGFLNPSVYCADLFRLISHIRLTVAADVTSRLGGNR